MVKPSYAWATIILGVIAESLSVEPDHQEKRINKQMEPQWEDDDSACHRLLWAAERKMAHNACGAEMYEALEALEAKKKSCQKLRWAENFEASRYELHDRVRTLCGKAAAPYDTYVPDRDTQKEIEAAEEKFRTLAKEEKEELIEGALELDEDVSKEELKKDISKIEDGEVEGEADLQSAQDVLSQSNLSDAKEIATVDDVRLVTAGALNENPDGETLPLQENDPQSAGETHVFMEGDMRVPKEKAAVLIALRKEFKAHYAARLQSNKTKENPIKKIGQKIEETGVVIGDTLRPIFLPPKKRIAAGAVWPNGDVPYCFAPDISAAAKRSWKEAVEHYRNSPAAQCIRMREVSAQGSKCNTGHGIFVQSGEAGCWADMGYSRGGNAINLGRGCEVKGLVIHEIGHALGMDHEQSRPDRDQYIKVNYENIKPGLNDQFDINPHAYTKEQYDYLSVMHYGMYSFSKSRGRLPTIEANDGRSSHKLGQAMGLSDLDVKQLGDMYCVGVDMTWQGRKSARSGVRNRLPPASQLLCMVAALLPVAIQF